ncbi:MAG: hypothetical protein CMJ49_13455 [Planctomycetaceae bacterium]|nr:hypothetical protein [Planctomycetaceae bacterium]
MLDTPLSTFGQTSATPAPANRMMDAFAADFRDGIDINLGVGYVNEEAIPRDRIAHAMRAVLDQPQRYRASLNYGGPVGSPNLVRSLRDFLIGHAIGQLNTDVLDRCRLIIGASGASSILDAFAQLLPTGIVITTDPAYYIFSDLLQRVGHRVIAVPEDEHGIDPDAVRAALHQLGDDRRHVRFFYIATVNNPSCTILSNDRRRALTATGAELTNTLGRAVPMLFDTAYELLIHDPTVTPVESVLLHDEAGIAYEIGTLSKILAPALRVGYVIGSDGPLIDALVQRNCDVGFSAPLINQEIASYLLDNHIGDQLVASHRTYHDKAQRVGRWIDQHLGPYLESTSGGRAGFYHYLTFRDIETHEDAPFFKHPSRTTGDPAVDGRTDQRHPRVVFIPGAFCVHPDGQMTQIARRQLRISYGYEPADRIHTALQLMAEAAAWVSGQRDNISRPHHRPAHTTEQGVNG